MGLNLGLFDLNIGIMVFGMFGFEVVSWNSMGLWKGDRQILGDDGVCG